ncbi:MAG: class I SAM-dependent methyltransferase [Clostridiaceae bacterium]|nr:class I SAM-dependent methyltransferase [Clostridiaceae bacterium]
MDKKYEKSMETENKIFKEMQENITVPDGTSSGFEGLDKALDWLCDGSESILDFGCGSGTLLFLCANRGTKEHIGIDLAVEGISFAKKRCEIMKNGHYSFIAGSIDALKNTADNSVDGIIVSNVIDNMYPDDARSALKEFKRILKLNGKVMIKLNPYLTKDELAEFKELEKDVYDDGLILWNRKTEEWQKELRQQFKIVDNYEFTIPQVKQVNRVFKLVKNA